MSVRYICRDCKASTTVYASPDELPTDTNATTATKHSRLPHRPETLDEWIDSLDVDSARWSIERADSGLWDFSVKGPDGTIETRPHHRFAARFVAKRPQITEFPTLRPVTLATPRLPATPSSLPDVRTAVVFGDTHFGFRRVSGGLEPFHDVRCLDILRQVVADISPDVIVHLGDALDLPELSDKFLVRPEFVQCTQPAIDAFAGYMAAIRDAAPDSQIHVIEGNHDERMQRMMVRHVLAAANLRNVNAPDDAPAMGIAAMCDLDGIGATYHGGYPNGKVWLNDNLVVVHGDIARAQSGHSASAMLKDAGSSVVFGHVHRRERVDRTMHGFHGRRDYTAASFGCMCRVDGVVPSRSSEHNWQQGFGVVRLFPGDHFDLDFVEVFDHPDGDPKSAVAYAGGRQYVGRAGAMDSEIEAVE